MKRLTTEQYNALTPDEQVRYFQESTAKMQRQQAGMDTADALAPLVTLGLLVVAAVAYYFTH